ncbi:sugar ABC transporter permease, partial [Burkholderia gladioli]|nr:sugar ABC transporter permease [Burkholderia gladioli]
MPRSTLPWLLIVPSLLLALLIISYPVFNIIYQSLHEVSRFGTVRGFSGLDNFRAVFADPVFIGSLWRTVYWTACVVGGTVLISVPVALVLNAADDLQGLELELGNLPES